MSDAIDGSGAAEGSAIFEGSGFAPPGTGSPEASGLIAAVDSALSTLVDLAWGTPLIVLLLGGGALLLVASRGLPLRMIAHAVAVLFGRYDDPNDPGEISHFQALATALSSTIGLGNIAGVAIAISQGGPGAVFWMWIAALVGMTTKFFTCTLAVLYRKPDEDGVPQGGPMYTIEMGLGPRWRPLAILFSVFGTIGCLAMFQTNQMAEILEASWGLDRVWVGAAATVIVGVVVLGGLQRIAKLASRLVPAMCGLYLLMVGVVLVHHAADIPAMFLLIIRAAFNPEAALGGALGVGFMEVLRTGVKRAAFSNEAGIGTAAMAHGAAKTKEPVREGLVAMLGPFIDTIVVCSLTAFAILATGLWNTGGDLTGVAMTSAAFESVMGITGRVGLTVVVVLFGLTTMFGYSYYGRKCFTYLFGKRYSRGYDIFFVLTLFAGAVWSADIVVNLLDSAFALMAFPNMIATLVLAPVVMRATRDYFERMDAAKR